MVNRYFPSRSAHGSCVGLSVWWLKNTRLGYTPGQNVEGEIEMEKLGTTLTLVALVFTFLGAGLIEQNTSAGGWCSVIGVISLIGIFVLDEKTRQ